jgi:YfiH family protein
VFASRDTRHGRAGRVDVAFTDRHGGVSPLVARAFGVATFATMRQTHGREVTVVSAATADAPTCDALVTAQAGVALCVRVADCVPVVLADSDAGVVAAAHAGRQGVAAGVVDNAVATMRSAGARDIEAWIGPHVCGGCYEVPAQMRAEVAAGARTAFACTTWGTPSLDLGAAVTAQLAAAGCTVNDHSRCTLESDDLFSYRRDGAHSGRAAGLVVLRGPTDG